MFSLATYVVENNTTVKSSKPKFVSTALFLPKNGAVGIESSYCDSLKIALAIHLYGETAAFLAGYYASMHLSMYITFNVEISIIFAAIRPKVKIKPFGHIDSCYLSRFCITHRECSVRGSSAANLLV